MGHTSDNSRVNRMRGAIVLGTRLTRTRTVLVHQNQLQSGSISFRRSLLTSATRLSDDKKVSDQASLAKKIDPKEAAARKAAEEATKKALEKKRIEDAAAKKEESNALAAQKKKEEEAALAAKKKKEE